MHQYSNLAYLKQQQQQKKTWQSRYNLTFSRQNSSKMTFLYQTIKLSATPERKGEVTCQTLNIHMYKNHQKINLGKTRSDEDNNTNMHNSILQDISI